MCFNKEYSFTYSIIGIVILQIMRNNPDKFHSLAHIPILFYTIMEVTQTIQHYYVNDCSNNINILLTNFAYVLIIVQPLLWNYVYLYRSRENKLSNTDEKILYYSLILSIIWMFLHIIRRFSYYREYTSELEMLKGPVTCTYKKNEKHLYWNYKFYDFNRYLDANWYTYLILFFVPGLLTDNKTSTSLNLIGCILTNLYVYINKNNYHEIGSIWCITSIPTLFISILPTIKDIYFK
jgi:hypothetical protein